MENDEIQREIDFFASRSLSFIFQEVLDLLYDDINIEEFRNRFTSDGRFLKISPDASNNTCYISRVVLLDWFFSLNARLADAKVFKLNCHKFALLVSSLRSDGRWRQAPEEIIKWAEKFGLMGESYEAGHYVFPLARMLSFSSENRIVNDKNMLFREYPMGRKHKKSVESELIRIGVANFERRTSRVIQAREGLGGQKPITLDGVGKVLGVTRERVRQIESRFWKKIREFPNKYRKPFIDALLCDFINESGSLLCELSSRRMQAKDFLFRCCRVPTVKLDDFGVLIAGVSLKQETALFSMLKKKSGQETSVDKIATYLESKIGLVLTRRDLVYLAKRIANYRVERIGMSDRIKKALESIGKPAHYSKIAAVHNSLFPKNEILERSVHNLLTNNADGIVWIGIKGTYALREWGYRRPSSTIFDAIAQIVKIKYRETGRPVPIIVIKAELGKLRKIVKDVSIAIATSLNPRIQVVGNNSFIPRKMSKQKSNQILEEKLDRGFEDFLQINRVPDTDGKT